ncbi:hypothetical protein MBCUT_06660 [Methanobrevibacter cuticularis]|uniref:Uncharacterized protein n=1 Tax=Methanobrevibacter cuticularis TaxID=47311 RepID=A0A166EGI6_9EURY|nr:hypothetical protein MBCUT_06660 [Methanobrevibacter cuticularis]
MNENLQKITNNGYALFLVKVGKNEKGEEKIEVK